MKKLITTILVVIQVCVLVLSDIKYLNGMDFSVQSQAQSSGVRSNISPMMAVVNANFSAQMKMIAGLIDFAADMGKKTVPSPKKEKQAQQQSKIYAPPVDNLSELKQSSQEAVSQNSYLVPALRPAITLYLFVVLLLVFLRIRRMRYARFFFLLPRGSIDDYIRNIILMFRLNPHCLKTTGVFSLLCSLFSHPPLPQWREAIQGINYV